MAKLKVLTWNTLFGGWDEEDDRRARMQADQINLLRPDIFLAQELRGFEKKGSARFFALEKKIGMRGFFAVAPQTGQNVAIFIREPLIPLSFIPEHEPFHHALASLEVFVPASRSTIAFVSAHLSPISPVIRRCEAVNLAHRASSDKMVLLAGDFNSSSPHDPEPIDWPYLEAQHRARYLADDMLSIDKSVMASLEAAGWIDVGNWLDSELKSTVPTPAYRDSEFATMRCDYFLASAALAPYVLSYEVIKNEITHHASDHYPVMVTLDC